MKKMAMAAGLAGFSVVLMGQAPGIQMIEFDGQGHPAFPCSQKNIPLKRSQCVDLKGWGGTKGKVFFEDYIIHCVSKGATKGRPGEGRPITYVSWNRIGSCAD